MATSIKKTNMITQIVRLRQVVRSWKKKSLRRSDSDSDEQPRSNRRTPSGTLAVYVGPERRRFVIPTRFLNFPVFVTLLEQAEEEFGFQTAGGLVLPCEPDFFRVVLRFLEGDEEKFCGLGLNDFVGLVSEVGLQSLDRSSCKDSSSSSSATCRSVTPLLEKTSV